MTMSAASPSPKRHLSKWVVLFGLGGALLLGGCGSSANSTSTTTTAKSSASTTLPASAISPPPPNASSVTAYLNGGGAVVVTFERATAPLTKGSIPTKGQCGAVAKSLTSGGLSGPDALATPIKGITDIPVQVAVRQDLQNKLMLLSACMQGSATAKQAATVQASSSVVVKELKGLGISI